LSLLLTNLNATEICFAAKNWHLGYTMPSGALAPLSLPSFPHQSMSGNARGKLKYPGILSMDYYCTACNSTKTAVAIGDDDGRVVH